MQEAAKLVPLFVSLIALVSWFIRLEAKILYLEKDHVSHKELTEKRDASLWTKIDTLQLNIIFIKESLARIEERLKK